MTAALRSIAHTWWAVHQHAFPRRQQALKQLRVLDGVHDRLLEQPLRIYQPCHCIPPHVWVHVENGRLDALCEHAILSDQVGRQRLVNLPVKVRVWLRVCAVGSCAPAALALHSEGAATTCGAARAVTTAPVGAKRRELALSCFILAEHAC